MRNLRKRIEWLEAKQPPEIILKLRYGSHFHDKGPALEFFMEAMEDIKQNRSSPLLKAILETVSAEGCGFTLADGHCHASRPGS
jgi:hypothetical protein